MRTMTLRSPNEPVTAPTNPVRILYIDDSSADRELVCHVLNSSSTPFEITEVSHREPFEHELSQPRHFDLVLSDFHIPGFLGLDVIDMVRERRPGIPVVIVTGTGSEETAVAAMKRGAADYVIKTGKHIQRLPLTINAVLEKRRLEAREEEAQRLLVRQLAILEATTDLVSSCAPDGRLLYLNKAGRKLLGLHAAEDVSSLTIARFHPPQAAKLILETGIPAAIRDGVWVSETVVTDFSGQEVPMSLVIIVHRGLTGNVEYLSTIARDISDQKRAEQTLVAERNLLRLLIDNLPAYIYFKDTQGRFLLTNLPTVRLFGAVNESETLMKTVFDYFPEPMARQYAEDDRAVIELGQSIFHQEERYQDPAGNQGWFTTTKLPLRNYSGKTIGLIGISRDITESKRAEEQLRVSEERLKMAFEASEAGYYEHSTDLKTGYLDEHCAAIFGYLLTELPATARRPEWWLEKIIPEEQIHFQPAYLDFLQGKTDRFQTELRIVPPQGSQRWIRIMAKTVSRQAHGRATTVAGIVQDITEQKIAEEQSRRSQKLEAIGLLAGGVAHDFNNLLQIIGGYAAMAMEHLSPAEESHSHLTQVKTAADRASQLTRQLLAFGRRQPLQKTATDLNEVVTELLKWVRRLIGEHIVVEFTPVTGLPGITGDKAQLEQVLMNLCVNARDAMPGGGQITIRLQATTLDDEFCQAQAWAHPGQYVCLSVADSGQGMDQQTLAHIFEPFFTTKPREQGTGLGLSVVYGVVKQHEGFLHVTSTPGHGSNFEVYLPAAFPATVATPPKNSMALARGTETILLAEDESGVRVLAQLLLERAGYRVLTAVTGEEAVHTFNQHADAIQLLVLDIVMPKLSGPETYEKILAKKPGLPVLFCSGYSSNSLLTEYDRHPEVGFIQKPYQIDELLAQVRRLLDLPARAV